MVFLNIYKISSYFHCEGIRSKIRIESLLSSIKTSVRIQADRSIELDIHILEYPF